MTDEEITEIRLSLASITPYPWMAEEDHYSWDLYGDAPLWGRWPVDPAGGAGRPFYGHPPKILKAPKRDSTFAEYWPNPADADFILKAPQRIAALVEEIDRLTAFVDRIW